MITNPKYLIVLCGPTASGKTEAAIELAEHYGTEIISTDSRQIFRELEIGTAKPPKESLERVPHHFIDSHSIRDDYSAGQFERDALELLEDLFNRHDVVIAAGGTGLYIRALVDGFDDIPQIDPAIREAVNREYEKNGLEFLQKAVQEADPEGYADADTQNPQRLIRLLEVYRATGKPRSAFIANGRSADRDFESIRIGLDVDRDLLYERINERVDSMMELGLLDEARELLPWKDLNALQTVGYSELFDLLEGRTSLEQAVELIKRNTRRYAKRQLTWFRRDADTAWFQPANTGDMIRYIDERMAGS